MKDIFIFGTCRICYPTHENIEFVQLLRKHHSRHYKIKDTDINIYTEPVNYTTKLMDILDSIYYMNNKLYADLDPFENQKIQNKRLQGIFFRGHWTFIRPNTHPNLMPFNKEYGKVIIEPFSIKKNIINTKKYGEEFYLQNLPWKLDTGTENHGLIFNPADFIIQKMSKAECFNVLHKIKMEVNCEVLVIGPYVSKKMPEVVNMERIETQNILKEFCSIYNWDYFDLSETIENHDIEVDETHFNDYGTKVLSDVMYDFIMK